MKPQQKAKEIAESNDIYDITEVYQSDVVDMLMQMHKWDKEQMIDKAMKVICNSCAQKVECEFNKWARCGMKDELIKAMEE